MPALSHTYPPALRLLSAAVMGVLLCHAPAQAQPVNNSSLYYRMGGGSPGGAAAYRGQLANTLGIQGNMRLNYSCGKFDIGLSWSNLMNGFSSLGTQVSNAVKAGIASLPLYVLQRAQPGLYQLFQNYSLKADTMIGAALKTCEEMEAVIRQGQNPYEDWVKIAQGDLWKIKATAGGDVVQAKLDLTKNDQAHIRGIPWFGGLAGGASSKPISPIHDISIAGYNVTLNKPATASPTTNYSASTLEKDARLVRAFPTPNDLAKFTTEVLGDKRIYTCTEGTSGCPTPTTVTTATGLGPKYEDEYNLVAPKLNVLASSGTGAGTPATYAELQTIAAPGMAVSPQLLDALRRLPVETRSIAVNRLSQELAMHRVIDKALVARAALLTGISLPEVAGAGDAIRDTQETINRLTRYIDDLMYESRIRKELTAETALAIMGGQLQADTQAMRVPDGRRPDPAPLDNGRVKP
ncbi:integrating conjugative element protein [Diaphorobacter limosus]|uniref:Integrating conjugative element protein n=1 Tax=Diaphorobacter limosus TaxID=3036128 RepID=A0ABZ0J8H2_9BURK|nr:integrating conjugative element protein [Diaphorobacter sp. Y-1]WOO33244.1 integrating conjugative element protein [Diaphorobacter sp. Y-1]